MFDALLSRWPKWAMFLLGMVLVVVTGLADFYTGAEYSFSIFYLPAIVIATWHLGERAGVVIALFSALAWALADWNSVAGYSQSIVPVWNTGVRLGFFLITLFLVAEVKAKLELAEDLAMTDTLTQVANSRRFYLIAESELARARRHNTPTTIAFIDLDNFKEVNDTAGHSEGDRVLRLVTSTILQQLRQMDVLARLGGDEFVILLPESDTEAAATAVSRLQERLLQVMQRGNFPVTFSIGVLTFDRPPKSVEVMIRQADDLMYMVKRAGKNEVRFEAA